MFVCTILLTWFYVVRYSCFHKTICFALIVHVNCTIWQITVQIFLWFLVSIVFSCYDSMFVFTLAAKNEQTYSKNGRNVAELKSRIVTQLGKR